jgi:hypothetical protein
MLLAGLESPNNTEISPLVQVISVALDDLSGPVLDFNFEQVYKDALGGCSMPIN